MAYGSGFAFDWQYPTYTGCYKKFKCRRNTGAFFCTLRSAVVEIFKLQNNGFVISHPN